MKFPHTPHPISIPKPAKEEDKSVDSVLIDSIETHLVKVTPTTSIEETIAQMNDRQTDRAFVVDGEQLVGIFTGMNLVEAIANNLDLGVEIERVMTPEPIILTLPAREREPERWGVFHRSAINLVRQHDLDFLCVVDNRGRFAGAIASSQLLSSFEAIGPPLPPQTIAGKTTAGLHKLVRELERRIGQRTAQLQESHALLVEEIRDRLLAQLEISKLEAQFQVAVDNIPNIFAIYDRHRRYQFINSEGVRCSGRSLEASIGLRDEEIFPPGVTSSYLPLLEGAIATRTAQSGECKMYNAQTQCEFVAVATYVPLLDDFGQVYQVLGIANDITERKQSEAQLKAATDRLRAVLDAVPGFVSWIVRDRTDDSMLCYEGVNSHLAASLNRSPEAFVGQPLGFMEGQSQFTEFIVEFMTGSHQAASRTIDVNIRGAKCSYLIAAQKYQQDTAAVSVGIDITERKQAEESLRYQLAFEQLVMSISTDFLNLRSEEIDGGIERALQQIGEFAGVDASYIFLFGEDGTQASMTHEWVSPGIEPERDRWQNISIATFSPAIEGLKRGEVLYIQKSQTPSTPIGWHGERVLSMAAVPAIYQGRTIGFIGFDAIEEPKIWSQSSIWLLRIVSEIVTNTLQRRQAERELRQSERKFRAIFDRAFQFVGLLHPDGTVVEINQTALNFAALTLPEVVGRRFWETRWWQGAPDVQTQLQKAIVRGGAGQFVREEVDAMGSGGVTVTLDFSLKPVPDEAGKVVLLIAEGRDITEQKLAQQERYLAYQRSQLLSEVTLKIRQSLELEEILQTAVKELQKLLQASRVAIFELESETTGRVVKEAVLPGWPTLAGLEIDDPSFDTSDAAGTNVSQFYAIADIESANSDQAGDFSLLRSYGVKAALVVPIWVSGAGTKQAGEETLPVLWGFAIAHQCDRPRQWTAFEIELLQQLADQMGIAISIAQLIDNLEDIVDRRTAQLRAVNQNLEREIRERRRAEIALRRSEQQLRLTADALPVAIAYVDARRVYRFNNRTYEDWLGKPLSQITGHPVSAVWGEQIYEACRHYIDTALSGSRVSYEIQQPEIDGTSRYLSVTYIPDISETGEVKGYFAVEIDISDRHAVEQMKDEFLSVASHELRTPLTSIRGSLGLLATGQLGQLLPKGQRMLDIALKNTDRLCRLINDILDLERMESGQIQILLQRCNAVELMFQAAEAMQAMAESAGVTLHAIWDERTFEIQNDIQTRERNAIDFETNFLPVWVDADRILQTLINLLSNAIKFSPPQETVSISLRQQDLQVCFQVSDLGRGIPSDQLDRIFGRFQQVDASDSRQKGGSGLGLAICRQIVQQHGGRIWAQSRLGVGSQFYVTLPLSEPKTLGVEV